MEAENTKLLAEELRVVDREISNQIFSFFFGVRGNCRHALGSLFCSPSPFLFSHSLRTKLPLHALGSLFGKRSHFSYYSGLHPTHPALLLRGSIRSAHQTSFDISKPGNQESYFFEEVFRAHPRKSVWNSSFSFFKILRSPVHYSQSRALFQHGYSSRNCSPQPSIISYCAVRLRLTALIGRRPSKEVKNE